MTPSLTKKDKSVEELKNMLSKGGLFAGVAGKETKAAGLAPPRVSTRAVSPPPPPPSSSAEQSATEPGTPAPELRSRLELAEAERKRAAEALDAREREMEAMRERMRDLEYKTQVMEQHIKWQASADRSATLGKSTRMAPAMGSDPYDDEPFYDTMSAKPVPVPPQPQQNNAAAAGDDVEVLYDMPIKTKAPAPPPPPQPHEYQEPVGSGASHRTVEALACPPPPPRISLGQLGSQAQTDDDDEVLYDSVPLNLLESERAAVTLQCVARGYLARRWASGARRQARQTNNEVAAFFQVIERSSQVNFFLMSSCCRYDKDNRSRTVKTLKKNAKLRRKEAKAQGRRDARGSRDSDSEQGRERASSIDSALSTSPAYKAAESVRERAQTACSMTRPSMQRTPPSSLSSVSRTSSTASDTRPGSPQRSQRDPLPPPPPEMSRTSTLSKPPTLSRPPPSLVSVSAHNSSGRSGAIAWYKKTERPRGAGLMADNRTPAPWFHGLISRDAAEAALSTEEDSAFLVRLSESRQCYVISLRSSQRCRHYMVEQNAAGKYGLLGREDHGVRILREPLHNSLLELIACFTRHRVNATQRLGTPCARKDNSGIAELLAGGAGGGLSAAKAGAGCAVHSMRLGRSSVSNSAA